MRQRMTILLSIVGLVIMWGAALSSTCLAAATPPPTGETEQLKNVKKDKVEKDNKVLDTDLEESSPDSVQLVGQGGGQTFTITTKTFLPPGKLLFDHFSAGVWVDVQTEPTGLTATEDAGNSEEKIKFTVTNMPTNAGEFPIKCEGNLTGTGTGGKPPHWSAKVAKYKVDLDIDGLTGAAEDSPGAAVVRNFDGNNAPRKKIVLKAVEPDPGYGEKQVLTRANTKVKVFTASSGGTEITFNGGDNEFEASQSMGDVTLKLALKKFPDIHDEVTFTVLWVTVSTRHAGAVSSDNAGRQTYVGLVKTDALAGPLRFVDSARGATVRGSEFLGTVKPSDFAPSPYGGDMHLARERIGGKIWFMNVPENCSTGNDDSDKSIRDDDPQSGGSKGIIYDLDAPGVDAQSRVFSENFYIRLRQNYESWAVYDGIRCSVKKPWFTRQSYQLSGDYQNGTVKSAGSNSITDQTQYWDVDKWKDGTVWVTKGTGNSQQIQARRVTGNSTTTIFVDKDWNPVLDNTWIYNVNRPNAWTMKTDVEGDNINGDGTTNLSEDLK